MGKLRHRVGKGFVQGLHTDARISCPHGDRSEWHLILAWGK